MELKELINRTEIRELVDTFAYLADIKDAKNQGDLFTEDGSLEFRIGFDGEFKEIKGRKNLVPAFVATIEPCKAVYHTNGQHIISFEDDEHAKGIAYCQATLVNVENDIEIKTVNSIIYEDTYVRQDGKWLIRNRKSTFVLSERKA